MYGPKRSTSKRNTQSVQALNMYFVASFTHVVINIRCLVFSLNLLKNNPWEESFSSGNQRSQDEM